MTGQGRYGTLAPDVLPPGADAAPDQGFAVRLEDYHSLEVTEQCLVDGEGPLMHVHPLSTKYGALMRQFVVITWCSEWRRFEGSNWPAITGLVSCLEPF